MPATRKLPDDHILRSLYVEQQRPLADIAAAYGVTTSAVWHRLDRRNLIPPTTKPGYADVTPDTWAIRQEHKGVAVMRNLRALANRTAGAEVAPEDERHLNNWLGELAAADVVLCYEPDAPPSSASRKGGFYYSARRPGDGAYCRA